MVALATQQHLFDAHCLARRISVKLWSCDPVEPLVDKAESLVLCIMEII